MSSRQYTFATPGGPVAQVLWLIGGAVVLVGALIMGVFVLMMLLGLGAVAAAVLAVRVWWVRRKLRRAGAFDVPGADPARTADARLIDAEYTVVDERDPERDERDRLGRS
jgi:uncharacterized iron-regulated membrane protein